VGDPKKERGRKKKLEMRPWRMKKMGTPLVKSGPRVEMKGKQRGWTKETLAQVEELGWLEKKGRA